MTTASAAARSSPITIRSWGLNPLISPPPALPGTPSETTPSSVETKLPTT
jgi:hypothetical protein